MDNMSKRAVIRGEFHVSNVDRKKLLERDLTDFKALYLEGRSDTIRIHKYTYSYVLYLIGYFSFELIYITKSVIHERILPFWAFDMEKKARNEGLDVEDEIDLEIDEIYKNINQKTIRFSLAIFAFAFIFTFLRAFYEETINFLWITTQIPYWILPLGFGILLPIGYSGLLITFGGGGERDETMASSIDSKAEYAGHDEILVLVGDKHVEPVGDYLEERGWTVKKERSKHPIPRIQRLLFLSERRTNR